MRQNTIICIAVWLCCVISVQSGMTQQINEPVTEKSKSPQPKFTSNQTKQHTSPLFSKQNKVYVFDVNQIRMIIARMDDTPLAIAKRYDIPLRNILRYNDLKYNQLVMPEQYVFLQPKRRAWRGKTSQHIVERGETMYSIAQFYGIRVKALRRKNKLPDGREPLAGQTIVIRGQQTFSPENEQGVKMTQVIGNEVPHPKGPFKPKPRPSTNGASLVDMEIAPQFEQHSTQNISQPSLTRMNQPLPVFRTQTRQSSTTLPMPSKRSKTNKHGAYASPSLQSDYYASSDKRR